jgi:hypothetical protein
MKVRVIETGKVVELGILDLKSGQDWIADFIGNSGALSDGRFTYDYDAELYIASAEEVEWWQRAIARTEEMNDFIEELKDVYESDYVDRFVNAAANGCCDYVVADDVISALIDQFGTRQLVVVAGNCGDEAPAYKEWLGKNLPQYVELEWVEGSGVGGGYFDFNGDDLSNPYWDRYCQGR